jgi:hypothetical protein
VSNLISTTFALKCNLYRCVSELMGYDRGHVTRALMGESQMRHALGDSFHVVGLKRHTS